MEAITIPAADLTVSRVALGTWAIGGWMWGGTDEAAATATIRSAVERGISLIDTAPVYGFGRSEEIVGKALSEGGLRRKVRIATKLGLAWKDGKVYRDSRPERIRREVEDSLKRLRTDVIDIYQVHWPDLETPIEETAAVLEALRQEGKIRAIGVSNYSPAQMETFRSAARLDTVQPPYNLFEREIEADILPDAVTKGLVMRPWTGNWCWPAWAGDSRSGTRSGSRSVGGRWNSGSTRIWPPWPKADLPCVSRDRAVDTVPKHIPVMVIGYDNPFGLRLLREFPDALGYGLGVPPTGFPRLLAGRILTEGRDGVRLEAVLGDARYDVTSPMEY